MRTWKTELHLRGGDDYPESVSTVYKSYNMKDLKVVLDSIRLPEIEAGMPKRKIAPVFRYLLEHLIMSVYFKEYAPKNAILEKIIIKDTKSYGI